MKRFNLEYRPKDNFSKDIAIKDRLDRQGVSIMFKKEVWKQLCANDFQDFPLHQSHNPNFITYSAKYHKNAIYRGIIVKSNQKFDYSYIRLTPDEVDNEGKNLEDEFQIGLGRYARYIPDAKEGIFQVTHEDCGKNPASLGSFYTIPGDLAVLVPYNNKIIISKEIHNGRIKKHLFDLGKEIQKTYNYGYIFRTASQYASDEEIVEEIRRLEQDLSITQKNIEDFPDRIGEIYSNYRSINIVFPAQVKAEFDLIRRQVMPTVDFHHALKSAKIFHRTADHFSQGRPSGRSPSNIQGSDPRGDHRRGKFIPKDEPEYPAFTGIFKSSENDLVDFAEALMFGVSQETEAHINKNFMAEYFGRSFRHHQPMGINHFKLTGKSYNLAPGGIYRIDHDEGNRIIITLRRRLREGGTYDGLDIPIERGDYALTRFIQGTWFYESEYYSHDNELKGKYYNINTPIELTRHGIQYIDLEVDVIENMVGERSLVDKELLDKAYELGIITEEIYNQALNIANSLLS